MNYKSLWQIFVIHKISLGQPCQLMVRHSSWKDEYFHIAGAYECPNGAVLAFGWKIENGSFACPYLHKVTVEECWEVFNLEKK